MNDIAGDAIVFECAYAARPAGSDDKAPAKPKELVNVPEFTDIHISEITCNGCRKAIVASGIEGLRCVYDINISNSTFVYRDAPTAIDDKTATLELKDERLIPEGGSR